jgi:hypothetical protein
MPRRQEIFPRLGRTGMIGVCHSTAALRCDLVMLAQDTAACDVETTRSK